MTHDETVLQILAFARHVGRTGAAEPLAVAQRRNWIDTDGQPTAEGYFLIEALGDQSHARTVFRGNF